MRYTQVGQKYIINLERGEDVLDTLTALCAELHIENGLLTGIGAIQGLSCGYYALEEKKYYFTQYDELVEAVSLSGNITLKNGAPYIHMHGVFTNTQNEAFGGHIEHMTVGIVLEVILEVLSSQIERQLDEKVGLYVLSCGV